MPIVTQIYNYLGAVHNAANPNALYMISYGGNDLIWLQNQAPPALSCRSPISSSLAAALTGSVAALQAAGARTIVVLDVYAYAKLVGPGGTLTASQWRRWSTKRRPTARRSGPAWVRPA